VRGLKSGRYLVRVPVSDRPKPLLAAVTIVAGHRVVPGRRPRALALACLSTSHATASLSVPASTGAGPKTDAPSGVQGEHGMSPSSAPKAIGRVARGAGEAAVTAVKASGRAALHHLLLLFLVSIVVLGGWAIIFPLARFIRPPRHP
jgi:hypothetical protein